ELGRDARFSVGIVGHSRAHYDCYPEDFLDWSHGTGPPNLQSFAREVLTQGTVDRTDLLVVGSRGGQVVLPNFWASGVRVPPAVVINGGCAMKLPTPVQWPRDAITFILLGGDDNFRGHFSHQEYVADAKSRVPKANSTTAILYVNEMQHMPQASLLSSILPHMLAALQKWEDGRGTAPLNEFRPILAALNRGGWSGRFLHTRAAGAWEDRHRVQPLRGGPPGPLPQPLARARRRRLRVRRGGAHRALPARRAPGAVAGRGGHGAAPVRGAGGARRGALHRGGAGGHGAGRRAGGGHRAGRPAAAAAADRRRGARRRQGAARRLHAAPAQRRGADADLARAGPRQAVPLGLPEELLQHRPLRVLHALGGGDRGGLRRRGGAGRGRCPDAVMRWAPAALQEFRAPGAALASGARAAPLEGPEILGRAAGGAPPDAEIALARTCRVIIMSSPSSEKEAPGRGPRRGFIHHHRSASVPASSVGPVAGMVQRRKSQGQAGWSA
ncbi:unnamed protein product, partial [Prorocentrum cordatum]